MVVLVVVGWGGLAGVGVGSYVLRLPGFFLSFCHTSSLTNLGGYCAAFHDSKAKWKYLAIDVVIVVGGGGCGGSCGGGMGRVGGGGGWELCFAFAWFLSFFLPYIVLNKSWRLLRCFS